MHECEVEDGVYTRLDGITSRKAVFFILYFSVLTIIFVADTLNMYGNNQNIYLGSMSAIHNIGKERHEWYGKYET
jgi:hypothetical protein